MASVLVTVAILIVIVAFALARGTPVSGNGCVTVNLPYSTGGAHFRECGSRARSMCASVGRPGAYTGAAANAVAVQCRKAGLPVAGGTGR